MWPRCAMQLLLAMLLFCFIGGAFGDCLAGQQAVVFGDSLSAIDSDMLFNRGRYSNGKLWVEYADWNLVADVALPGATACELFANTNISDPRRSLFGQLKYYQSLGLPGIKTSCFVIFIGLNDLSAVALQLVQGLDNPKAVFQTITSNITAVVYQLAAHGAQCFYIFSLPDPTIFPGVADNANLNKAASAIGMLTAGYNLFLQNMLASIPLPTGTKLSIVDAGSAFVAAMNGPAPNGSAWSSTTVPCQPAPIVPYNVSYDCGLCFWFNYYHPTTLAHQQIATQLTQQMCQDTPASSFCTNAGSSCQVNFQYIGAQIEDMVGSATSVVFAISTTFISPQVITTTSLVSSANLTFGYGLTFTNPTRVIQCSYLILAASSVITAASVSVSNLVVLTTTTINAMVSIVFGHIVLGSLTGSSSGTLTLASSALVAGSQIVGAGTLQCSGRGHNVVMNSAVVLATITVALTSSSVSQTRRTDLSTVTTQTLKGTAILGTQNLPSGTALIVDLSSSVPVPQLSSFSNYIGNLAATGGLLYLTGISSTSLPTVISVWSNAATTPIEIGNITTTTGFCVPVLVYGNTGSCTTSWSPTVDSCQSGCTCTLMGAVYPADTTKCVVMFCQTNNGNLGLLGLLALIAILPLAICVFTAWRCLRTREPPLVSEAYLYPQAYPSATLPQAAYPQAVYPHAVYPQAVYPQGAYLVPGAEAIPSQGYQPELVVPVPTPLGLGLANP